MRTLIIISVILLFASCKSRCVRFYDKHPECLVIESDTVVTYDTVITERVTSDTVLRPSGEIDTFYLTIDKVRTRIIRQVDTLQVTQTVEPDTIIKTNTIVRNSVQVKEKRRWWSWLSFLIGAVAGLGFGVWLRG